jgi:putative acetyltransferase
LNDLSLRPFASDDTENLCALWVESWNATIPAIDFASRLNWFRDWLPAHLGSGGAVICAELAGEIAGFVGIDPAGGHMEQLAVRPGSFGTGVGRALVDAAKALCPAGITLRVNQDNPRAVAFYRRAGFTVTAEGVNAGGTLLVFDMAWRPA